MHSSDTIAALATPPGQSGIAIVRLSGAECVTIADRIFRGRQPPSRQASHTLAYGRIVDEQGDTIDEVLLLIMRAPRSYTREDVVEIHCHGGSAVVRRVYRRVLEAGARAAEPGEFTRRAFLNGRLDLIQAEAVADLIRAKTDRSASAALEQLDGALSRTVKAVYQDLIEAASELEVALDFQEDEPIPIDLQRVISRIESARNRISDLLSTWDQARIVREGLKVVISGKPNVGKSTLLNGLLGINRAIVSDEPGTTRDTIEEGLVVAGVALRLIDTAGLRESSGTIEQEGIRRAEQAIENADLHIHVIDVHNQLNDNQLQLLSCMNPENTILVFNKMDLGSKIDRNIEVEYKSLWTSLLFDGVEPVRKAIEGLIEEKTKSLDHSAVISERHRMILQKVKKEISEAILLIQGEEGHGLVVAASLLRSSAERLGEMTGRTYSLDLLDTIFSHFCIGK